MRLLEDLLRSVDARFILLSFNDEGFIKPVALHELLREGIAVRLGMSVRSLHEDGPVVRVIFDDGSVGWYEAGWGPMMSDTAFFVKDVVSPNGAVSIKMPESVRSDDVDTHTKTSMLRIHRVGQPDHDLNMADEPGHQELCEREQAFMARAITENLDLTRHLQDAVQSLAICLAADESVRSGQPVKV